MKELIFEIPDELLDNTAVVVPVKSGKELIRCKDCKYFTPMSIYGHGLCDVHCNGEGKPEVVSEPYYCAWAERKKE